MQESINNQSMLKVGTILHGTYRIDSYLSSGGFGNTYIATNVEFDERVAIKEFFMKGVTQRDDNQTTVSVSNFENTNSFLEQKEKFKKEARRIRQLKNEHIVAVHDLFEENGTAYYVMDYVDGENLAERLKRTGKPMPEKNVREILPQILDALKSVHDARIWHLDLKPANIMLDKSGKVKLIDFGASKQLNTQKGGATTSTAISYTNGYAPREQMEQNYDKFGPWTDCYALGATLYYLLTSKRPPLPTDLDDDTSEEKTNALPMPLELSASMKKLILWLMKTNRMQRPQAVDEILALIKNNQFVGGSNNTSSNNAIQQNVYEGEETIISKPSIVEKEVKKEIKKETAKLGHEEVDLSSDEDLDETWKDKLWSYISDIKNIGIIFLVLIAISVPSYFIKSCSNNTSEFQKEYTKIYNLWRKPWNTVPQLNEIQDSFRVLADKGYGPAIYMLGIMCDDSLLASKYFQQSMEYLPKQADGGDMYAQCCLGEYLEKLADNGNPQDAVLWYTKSANQGFPVAMSLLARCYYNGYGIDKDTSKAMEWQLKAAQEGDAVDIFQTGDCYAEGQMGFPVDTLKALSFYSEAADKGLSSAKVALGEYYLFRDINKALNYFNSAASQNDAGALFNLGCISAFGKERGLTIDKDLDKAISYFEQSLQYGEVFQIHMYLAYCYVQNNNAEKAFENFSYQANNYDFDAEAQYRLYECYKNGYGTERDLKKADYWKKKAIEHGYKEQ